MVRRRGATRLDADRPALRLLLHHELREIDANVIIVRTDVSRAHALVILEDINFADSPLVRGHIDFAGWRASVTDAAVSEL